MPRTLTDSGRSALIRWPADPVPRADRVARRWKTARRSRTPKNAEEAIEAIRDRRFMVGWYEHPVDGRLKLLADARLSDFDSFVDAVERDSGYSDDIYDYIDALEGRLERHPLSYTVRDLESGDIIVQGSGDSARVERKRAEYDPALYEFTVKDETKSIQRSIKYQQRKLGKFKDGLRPIYNELRKPDITFRWIPNFQSIFMYDQGQKIGHVAVAFHRSLSGMLERSNTPCEDDLLTLLDRHGDARVIEVDKSHIMMPFRGKGLGKAMYEAVIDNFRGQPFYFIPNQCGPVGATSRDAGRVWKSLASKYPSEGDCLWIA